jgi:competence protein ComGC
LAGAEGEGHASSAQAIKAQAEAYPIDKAHTEPTLGIEHNANGKIKAKRKKRIAAS